MDYNVRTVYGAYIQTCLYRDIPPVYEANTTLNEKFGILNDTLPTSTDRPYLGFYGVGNKGHTMVVGANGLTKPQVVPHKAIDAALYNQIPFVLRPVTNDLTAAERAKYALRREETYGGIRYAAYYLRRLDSSNLSAVMQYKIIENGVETVTTFVPDSSCLNPTPPTISSTGVNVTSGESVSASSMAALTISSDEAAELRNVAKVLYDDEEYAIISEIALCTGVDKVVQVNSSGAGTFNFNEAIGVQIAQHVAANSSMVFNNTGTTINLNVGATEPMWSVQN